MKQEATMSQENKMGVMPINRLLVSMSVPIMISMLVQALYNKLLKVLNGLGINTSLSLIIELYYSTY